MKKYQILVVESQQEIRENLVTILKERYQGSDIQAVTSGVEAVKVLKQTKIDLLFLDQKTLNIKSSQTLALVKNLEEKFAPKAIFLLSGEGEVATETGTDDEVFKLIEKPFSDDDINAALDEVLQQGASGESEDKNEATPVKRSTDFKFMKPFIESCISVLDMTFDVQAKNKAVEIYAKDNFKGDISSVYPIDGDFVEGIFAISFPADCFLKMMSNMFGEEFTEIDAENQDGIAELCNQIYGQAKVVFNDDLKMNLKMQSPLISLKKGSQGYSSNFKAFVNVTFESNLGDFYMITAIKKKS